MEVKAKKKKKSLFTNSMKLAAGFAILNVIMYFAISKFWIGGSSFLPMIGQTGENGKFLFAFIVNMGVIAGAFIGAFTSKEYKFRLPKKGDLPRAITGGAMIGAGVTLAPGTCSTCFVTGMPMLSVSSLLSAAGIFIGGYLMFRMMWRKA